ncbi:response regulator [Paenibacillus alkaliterrae]|uniref:response regulator transcription factor n=1 Tax=Paenibacillus alkaliterrae TaxID=320909 RepID=UPI001F44851A|nr:response regulator [Paenibacillus alkaliterrae]MCF2938061.1 response regulator [Paenibacillus alkaliterrae]
MHSILIVEDERWVRTALRKTIEKTGLPFKVVHELTNGVEAVDWLSHNEADMVLTDIRMPVMDGLALIEEIQRRKHMIQVVIVSGHDDFSYAQQAIRLGAFDYLLKPVETESMAACLHKWLEEQEREKVGKQENLPLDLKEISSIERVIRHIDSLSVPDLTMTEAAAMVHLNPSYFCKLFKQQTNINFTDYMTSVRMKEATRLLEKTSLRISEIAERLGYADLAYFSNTFKKSVKVTPSEYRKLKP